MHLDGIQPQAGIILCSSNVDQRQMLDAVLESFPGISLIGCTTAGDFSGSYGFSDDSITLILAAEIQRRFLPQESPRVRGLEIACKNIPCEEIGGDYFDYLSGDEHSEGFLNVVVGDVTGHGVEAALLLTGAFSFLRSRISRSGTIAEIISEMNHHLTLIVFDPGRFMTLFFHALDLEARTLRWVRAGHDPAVLYDPYRDTFQELKGKGVPLGLDESFEYEENSVTGVDGGQIIAIGTDGIWEARNTHGEMFGKARFRDALRRSDDMKVEEIIAAIFEELKEFTTGVQPEGDVTLVIMRVKDEGI
jgi:phosphoserine phosphatase RsbU/P